MSPIGPPVFSVDVTNFALVNYMVPAERVRRHLPDTYELETFRGDDDDYCFVTTTFFCNHDFRPAVAPWPKLTFDESTYRTYVTHRGRAGVYFFGRYLSRPGATVPQRLFARDTWDADFTVAVEQSSSGYEIYSCHGISDAGETSLVLSASYPPGEMWPFASARELVDFFTYRLYGFFTSSVGIQGNMPVRHPHMDPWMGQLSAAKLDLWSNLEIVADDEMSAPHCVLVQPAVPFTLYGPRPLS
jgi:uncharacterized protein YqjF (DUF2071 family)